MDFIIMIGSTRHVLPVNPGSIKFTSEAGNERIDIVKTGEATMLGTKRISNLSFESFFPLEYSAPFINKKAVKTTPEDWVKRIKDSMLKPIRFIVTTTKINSLYTIESFTHEIFDGRIEYTLELSEYVENKAKYLPPPKPTPKPPEPVRPAPTPILTVGATVVVNGRLHRDSYGSGPGQTEVNATRKIHKIVDKPQSNQKWPIHITTLDGAWRGWVTRESVKRV